MPVINGAWLIPFNFLITVSTLKGSILLYVNLKHVNHVLHIILKIQRTSASERLNHADKFFFCADLSFGQRQISRDFVYVNFRGLSRDSKDFVLQTKLLVLRGTNNQLCKGKNGNFQDNFEPHMHTLDST